MRKEWTGKKKSTKIRNGREFSRVRFGHSQRRETLQDFEIHKNEFF